MSSSQKKPEPQFIRMSSNSFIYIPKKNTASQFLRLYSNSFVCLPIHSYVFSAGMVGMSSNSFVCLLGGDGGWRAGMVGGGGGRLYLFIFSRGEGGRGTLLFCVYSNAFVNLPIHSYVFGKKLKPNSFVCLPIHWGGVAPPNQDYYFAVHSYVFQFMGLDGGTPPNHYYYFAEIIIMNRNRFIIIISAK